MTAPPGMSMRRRRLSVGLLALALLLAAEVTLVLRFRKLTLEEYLAGRDPLAGTVSGCSGLSPSFR